MKALLLKARLFGGAVLAAFAVLAAALALGGGLSGERPERAAANAAASGTVLAAPCLNVRSGPGVSNGLVGCLPKGTVLTIPCTSTANSVSGPFGVSALRE